jgi:chromate transport protein ChrA
MDEQRETLSRAVRYGKWAGLYGGVAGLIAHQQIASSWIYTRCPEQPWRLVLTTAIACAVVALATAVWSWSVRHALADRTEANLTTTNDRFIATLSVAFAIVAVLFIVFSAAAAFFLQCER